MVTSRCTLMDTPAGLGATSLGNWRWRCRGHLARCRRSFRPHGSLGHFQAADVPATPAAGLALAVCVLMPQWERFGGHFSLSHLWAIPLLVWLLDAFKHESNRAWTVVYVAGLVLHPPVFGPHGVWTCRGCGFHGRVHAVDDFAARVARHVDGGRIASHRGLSIPHLVDGQPRPCPSDPAGFWDNHSHSGWFLPQHGPLAMWFADLSDLGGERIRCGRSGVGRDLARVGGQMARPKCESSLLHLRPSPLLVGCSLCLPWDGCFKPPLLGGGALASQELPCIGKVCLARHLPVQRRAARMGVASICTEFMEALD